MNERPSAISMSWSVTMPGWLSALAARASRTQARLRGRRPPATSVGQHLERDLATELLIDRAKHLPHRALAELAEDPVVEDVPTVHR